ncbi:Hypothetical_protein [Hexamita inflata]|uniref:Hypothetical_protein n=1 Tax=Hexamita inflata TaxID=28002 RepID=A0AA86ULT6_9EUKA|nr:Hypothetical protein HINF_LOCUS31908 [Hexamita inflata]
MQSRFPGHIPLVNLPGIQELFCKTGPQDEQIVHQLCYSESVILFKELFVLGHVLLTHLSEDLVFLDHERGNWRRRWLAVGRAVDQLALNVIVGQTRDWRQRSVSRMRLVRKYVLLAWRTRKHTIQIMEWKFTV